MKHSSRGNKSLSESGNCCHFAISGGIKISKYLGCKIYNIGVRKINNLMSKIQQVDDSWIDLFTSPKT